MCSNMSSKAEKPTHVLHTPCTTTGFKAHVLLLVSAKTIRNSELNRYKSKLQMALSKISGLLESVFKVSSHLRRHDGGFETGGPHRI